MNRSDLEQIACRFANDAVAQSVDCEELTLLMRTNVALADFVFRIRYLCNMERLFGQLIQMPRPEVLNISGEQMLRVLSELEASAQFFDDAPFPPLCAGYLRQLEEMASDNDTFIQKHCSEEIVDRWALIYARINHAKERCEAAEGHTLGQLPNVLAQIAGGTDIDHFRL